CFLSQYAAAAYLIIESAEAGNSYPSRSAGHLLVGSDGTGRFVGFLKQQGERGAQHTNQHAKPKSVNVAQERALLLKGSIENCERFFCCRPIAGVARESSLEVRKLLLKIEIELRHVPNK